MLTKTAALSLQGEIPKLRESNPFLRNRLIISKKVFVSKTKEFSFPFPKAVSYTQLDVYKRQGLETPLFLILRIVLQHLLQVGLQVFVFSRLLVTLKRKSFGQ